MAPRLSLGDLASVNTLRRFVPYKLRAGLKESLVYPLQALRATGRADLFSNVSIETTTTCTRQCAYCPHSVESARRAKHERGLFMSPELFTNITDQLQALGFSGKLALQGFGEPLADPDIIARIQEAREKMPFAYITINSNAQLLTGELLEKLLAAGLSHIYITNHETDPEQRTTLGVKIKALRADPRFATCISYYTKLTSLRNRGGAVDPTRFQQFESEGRTSNSTGREICASETNTLNITASGNVLVCGDSFTEDPDSVMGNLNESTIPEIYLSQKFQEIRKNIRNGIFNCGVCQKCNVGGSAKDTTLPVHEFAKRNIDTVRLTDGSPLYHALLDYSESGFVTTGDTLMARIETWQAYEAYPERVLACNGKSPKQARDVLRQILEEQEKAHK